MIRLALTVLCAAGAFIALGVFTLHPRPRVANAAFPFFVALMAAAIVLGAEA